MTEIDYAKRRLHLEVAAASEGYPQNTMPSDDGLDTMEIPAEPSQFLAITGDNDRFTLGTWQEVTGAVEEDILYGHECQRIVDLDTGQDAGWDVRVHVERPGQSPIEHLRAMHKGLFPERYGLDQYGCELSEEEKEEGYISQWDSGTIEWVAAAIERALVDDGSVEIEAADRERYRAELRHQVQS